jgi:hypothetical protein
MNYSIIIVQVRYITNAKTKEVVRIGYNGFLFQHSYSGDGLGALHQNTRAEKETLLIQYEKRVASFISIVLHLIPVPNLVRKTYNYRPRLSYFC